MIGNSETTPEDVANLTALDCSGTTVVVTGGTDGIGELLVYSLARINADVIFTGRDREKGQNVTARAEGMGAGTVEAQYADFTDLSAVRSLGEACRAEAPDILVHNAGGIFREGELTETGAETTITVNYLAPFVLTRELLPALKESGGDVVSVSSNGHRFADFDLDAFETTSEYSAFGQYNLSKLALLMFTYALNRQCDSLRANAIHPGFVPGSAFYREFPRPFQAALNLLRFVPRWLIRRPVVTEKKAAASVLNLSVNPDLREESGKYYELFEPVSSSHTSQDISKQDELWEYSEGITGIDEFCVED